MTRRGLTLAVAESCTGGLAGALLTETSGASAFFRGSLVVYADELKADLLKVPLRVFAEHGAVSRPCVEHMATVVAQRLGAQVGWAISGVAGPDGGSPAKPVGTVWQGLWYAGQLWSQRWLLTGTRQEIRVSSVQTGAEWAAICLGT